MENSGVTRRLDAIIALLARDSEKEMGENILTLSRAGLNSVEIAKILGRSNSYIRSELSRKRKSAKR